MSALAKAMLVDMLSSLILAIPLGTAFMALMGVLHANVSPTVPPIGFGASYPIALLAGICYQLLTVHAASGAVSGR